VSRHTGLPRPPRRTQGCRSPFGYHDSAMAMGVWTDCANRTAGEFVDVFKEIIEWVQTTLGTGRMTSPSLPSSRQVRGRRIFGVLHLAKRGASSSIPGGLR
jgi:hypothetical protein